MRSFQSRLHTEWISDRFCWRMCTKSLKKTATVEMEIRVRLWGKQPRYWHAKDTISDFWWKQKCKVNLKRKGTMGRYFRQRGKTLGYLCQRWGCLASAPGGTGGHEAKLCSAGRWSKARCSHTHRARAAFPVGRLQGPSWENRATPKNAGRHMHHRQPKEDVDF